ncbi:sulfurtransferase [Tahibacter soli]|uniref:Sulfurtransferase n=1 Tax=Tahibacter soli TaxID=2983605 RepID=A0A9X3YSD8_9GAMM|nr:rhodanese-like domain-containing protein [Tahibacter soli]MDC8015511.1 rhodanese-like domain-containing protein [Tahibacter soli]
MRRLAFVLLVFVLPAHGREPAIVDARQAHALFDRGAVFVDVRKANAYDAGHVPRARSLVAGYAAFTDRATDNLLAPAAAAETISALGVALDGAPLVVYGARGSSTPYYVAFALAYYGARDVAVFADGIEAWNAAALPVSTEVATPERTAVKIRDVRDEMLIDLRQLQARRRKHDVQLVDARSPAEFRGESRGGWRGGHLPGAVNIPFQSLRETEPDADAKTASLALRPRAQLEALFAGLDPRKETVVYCQSGGRSAATYVVLRDLGFRNVRMYDGSWREYSNRLDLPAEDVTYFDADGAADEIDKLKARIEALEKRLDTAPKS